MGAHKKARLKALLLGLALLGTSVLGFVRPALAASDYTPPEFAVSQSINDTLHAHQRYLWLRSCFQHDDIDKVDYSNNEMENWGWFREDDLTRAQIVGNSEGADDDAIVNCDTDSSVGEAFGLLGFTDPTEVFCSLAGAKFDNIDTRPSKDECMANPEEHDWDNDGVSQDELRKSFDALVQTTSEGKAAAATASKEMQYLRYMLAFQNQCNPTYLSDYSSGAANDPKHYKVPFVTPKGDIKYVYAVAKDDGTRVALSATTNYSTFGNDDRYDGGDQVAYGYISNCGDVMVGARKYAADYAAYVKAHPDDIDGTGLVGSNVSGTDVETDSGIDTDCGVSGIISNPLKWLACPIVKGFSTAAGILDNAIMGMLCVDEAQIFSANAVSTCNNDGANAATSAKTSQAYKTAWNVFRIIALGLLAIAGLVMILSQTIGLEIFDAYTIRKVLPRLLVAAIGITLSWELMQFFVGLSNILGVGIRGLIYAPFVHAGLDKQILGGGTAAVGILTTLGAFAILGPLGVLSLVGTALLAIFIAFFVLVIRNLLIVLLIILAPIAIVAYILPNTEKYWKIWWEWFIKALMVFPIITAFIAAGHVFSAIATAQGQGQNGVTGTITNAAGFIAYFAPYFLIPFAFRLAGGAMATIGGLANDRSRGAFDRLKKFRGEKAKYNFGRLQNQTRWDNNSWLGKRANKVGTWVTDPYSNAAYKMQNVPGFRKKGTSIAAHIEHQQMEQTRKLAETFNNSAGFNDKAYRAVNGALHDGLTASTKAKLAQAGMLGKNLSSLSDFDRMAGILASSDDQTERLAANALHGIRGTAATMYQDPEQFRASLAGAGMMGLAQHGFMNPHDLADAANMLTGATAEYDEDNKLIGTSGGHASERSFAQALTGQAQLIGARSRPDIKNGYALSWDQQQGKFVNGLAEIDDKGVARNNSLRALDELATMTGDDIGGAKAGIYSGGDKGLGDAMKFVLEEGSKPLAQQAAAEVATWSDERKTAAKQQNSPDYQKRKLAMAAEQHESFKQKFAQILGPYSRASIDNTTAARKLLSEVPDLDISSIIGDQDAAAADAAQRAADGGGGGGGDPFAGGSMGG